MNGIDELKAQVDELDQEQLKELKAYISYRTQQGNSKSNAKPTNEQELELLYSAIQEEFTRRGLPSPSWYQFKRSEGYRYLQQDYDYCQAFFEAHFPNKRIMRKQAYAYSVKLLIDWLATVGAPVTAGVIARNVKNIPGVLERQFPGYASSGLLSLVFVRKGSYTNTP